MKLTRSAVAGVLAGTLLCSCAAQGGAAGAATAADDATPPGTVDASPLAPRTWEPWPPPDAGPDVARPAPTGELVTLPIGPQGAPVLELLALVSEQTGDVFLYDEATNQKIRTAKVQGAGTWRVPKSRLVDALRAGLSYYNLALVPVGAPDAPGTWCVLDQNNPAVRNHPLPIRENEVLGYADCDGLLVVTSLRIRDMVDTSRVRGALTALTSTSTGGGRIQDVPGSRTILVLDYAPVVAGMKRIVDEMNRSAVPPPAAAAPTPAAPQAPAPK